ncbi:hypothetical protein KI387_034440, partial [Taxus chinensis]
MNPLPNLVDESPVALDSIRRSIGGEDPVQQVDLLIDFSEMKASKDQMSVVSRGESSKPIEVSPHLPEANE